MSKVSMIASLNSRCTTLQTYVCYCWQYNFWYFFSVVVVHFDQKFNFNFYLFCLSLTINIFKCIVDKRKYFNSVFLYSKCNIEVKKSKFFCSTCARWKIGQSYSVDCLNQKVICGVSFSELSFGESILQANLLGRGVCHTAADGQN